MEVSSQSLSATNTTDPNVEKRDVPPPQSLNVALDALKQYEKNSSDYQLTMDRIDGIAQDENLA